MDFKLDYNINNRGEAITHIDDTSTEKISIVELPGSKSITNRALIIRELCGCDFQLPGMAKCDDTFTVEDALKRIDRGGVIDVGASGTAMRFLTALFAASPGVDLILTGSERMKARPIAPLTDALIKLGAKISFLENPGYPPMKIEGRQLKGGVIGVRGNVSSQFISALMLIAPILKEGLKIFLLDKIVSESYIAMTVEIMRQFGIIIEYNKDVITIENQSYMPPVSFSIEADWTSASYFYGFIALSRQSEIFLSGLNSPEKSLQGDVALIRIFKKLGVETVFENSYTRLSPCKCQDESPLCEDLSSSPDLVPALVVTACLLNRNFCFSDIANLRLKECDRLAALVVEMRKLGFFLRCDNDSIAWNGEICEHTASPSIDTYNDHRMAMAFALAVVKFPNIVIKDAMVVTKSFPAFWNELQRLGLSIQVQ